MKISSLAFPALISALMISCGNKDEAASGSSELNGTWQKACKAADSGWSTETQVLNSGTATVTSTTYSDADCTTETFSMVASATYTTGAAVSNPTGAKELDITISKLMLTLKTDELVSAFNGVTSMMAATCVGGFVKNVAKELNATNCANDSSFGNVFTKSYNIFKLEGTSQYQGDCGDSGTATDCTAATKRPTTLESEAYKKI